MSTATIAADVYVSNRIASEVLHTYHAKIRELARRGLIRTAPALPGCWARYNLSDVQRLAEAGGVASLETAEESSPGSGRAENVGLVDSN